MTMTMPVSDYADARAETVAVPRPRRRPSSPSPSSADASGRAPPPPPPPPVPRGPDGVLLKKFEAVLRDVFSVSGSGGGGPPAPAAQTPIPTPTDAARGDGSDDDAASDASDASDDAASVPEALPQARPHDARRPRACPRALRRLTPRYSALPPEMPEDERRALVRRARRYWESRGHALVPHAVDADADADDGRDGRRPPPWPFEAETGLPQCGCVRGGGDTKPGKKKKRRKGKKERIDDRGGVGDVRDAARAWRKEAQLANLIRCALAMLPDDVRRPPSGTEEGGDEGEGDCGGRGRPFRIVDFAGGTGHLAVPLALLLPDVEVVCVDLKKFSLDLLHRRVDGPSADEGTPQHDDKLHLQSATFRTSKTLPNLSTYHGSIQTYPDEFDIGVSLHACGEASDWVLRRCLDQRPRRASWIVCSCCCGKLRRDAANPYVYQSTGGNEKGIRYPQSGAFATLGRGIGGGARNDEDEDDDDDDGGRRPAMTPEMFDEIARAADYSPNPGDDRVPRHACRRAAKSLVEWDRLLFARECLACDPEEDEEKEEGEEDDRDDDDDDDDRDAPNAVLTRMVPWEASVKNDILLGWSRGATDPYRRPTAECRGTLPSPPPPTAPRADPSCDVDFRSALRFLFGEDRVGATTGRDENGAGVESAGDDGNDWTAREEADVASRLKRHFRLPDGGSGRDAAGTGDGDDALRFPTGMGPRRRKLIHCVAERMGLRHWGEGKKDSEKIVVVARRRR